MDYPDRDIRFTTTEDGVAIAFWEIGEGKPVVILNNLSISHAELEWTVPSLASFYEDMAERYRVIRFDPRGCGLSDEPPGGWGAVTSSGAQQGLSTHEMGADITAVTVALGLASFTLVGVSVQGPVAIEYTATHPQVSELILCDSFAAAATSHLAPWLKTQALLVEVDADAGRPFNVWEKIGPPDETNQLVNLARSRLENTRAELTIAPAQNEWDAERYLSTISVPTFIISSRERPSLPDARHLAAGIAGSQLRVIDGGVSPYWSDRTATLEAIDAFLRPEIAQGPATVGFRTVVFTDIVDSTAYVRLVGDEAGRSAVRELEQLVASLAADHGGRVVKNLGDGSLVSFGSNSSAIAFGLEVQDSCGEGPLRLRVGMAAGEPIQEDGDIHGTVVAQASRIGDLGEAGDVIVSDSVRQLAAGKGFVFEPRGEVSLKGFDEPERVWKVLATRRP